MLLVSEELAVALAALLPLSVPEAVDLGPHLENHILILFAGLDVLELGQIVGFVPVPQHLCLGVVEFVHNLFCCNLRLLFRRLCHSPCLF